MKKILIYCLLFTALAQSSCGLLRTKQKQKIGANTDSAHVVTGNTFKVDSSMTNTQERLIIIPPSAGSGYRIKGDSIFVSSNQIPVNIDLSSLDQGMQELFSRYQELLTRLGSDGGNNKANNISKADLLAQLIAAGYGIGYEKTNSIKSGSNSGSAFSDSAQVKKQGETTNTITSDKTMPWIIIAGIILVLVFLLLIFKK